MEPYICGVNVNMSELDNSTLWPFAIHSVAFISGHWFGDVYMPIAAGASLFSVFTPRDMDNRRNSRQLSSDLPRLYDIYLCEVSMRLAASVAELRYLAIGVGSFCL